MAIGTPFGFTGNPKDVPEPLVEPVVRDGTEAVLDVSDSVAGNETEGHDEDSLSQIGTIVMLDDHLRHVAAEAATICDALGTETSAREAVVRAARWHDLGKAHEVFQDTMRRGLDGQVVAPDVLLAKTVKRTRHGRGLFSARTGVRPGVSRPRRLVAGCRSNRLSDRRAPRQGPDESARPAQGVSTRPIAGARAVILPAAFGKATSCRASIWKRASSGKAAAWFSR